MTEAELQQGIIDAAHTFGWRVAHFRSVRVQRKDGNVYYQTPVQADGEGFPDLVLVNPDCGRVLYIEVKSEKGKCTLEQVAWQDALAMCDQEVYVVRPAQYDEIIEILMLKEKPTVAQRCQYDSAVVFEQVL